MAWSSFNVLNVSTIRGTVLCVRQVVNLAQDGVVSLFGLLRNAPSRCLGPEQQGGND
jgi:hypothetical protein